MPHTWCLCLPLPTNAVDTHAELQHHILAVSNPTGNVLQASDSKSRHLKEESFIGDSAGRGPEHPKPHILGTARWEYPCGVALLILLLFCAFAGCPSVSLPRGTGWGHILSSLPEPGSS